MKEIPDHNTMCFAMLCCLLVSFTCLFTLCCWLFTAKPVVAGFMVHVGTSAHPPPPVFFRWIASLSPVPPCATYSSAYTAATNSEQTNNLPIVYTNNIPICNVCLLCQPSREWTDAPGVGAELQLGIKMPTLHYGWSRSLLLAAWVWG